MATKRKKSALTTEQKDQILQDLVKQIQEIEGKIKVKRISYSQLLAFRKQRLVVPKTIFLSKEDMMQTIENVYYVGNYVYNITNKKTFSGTKQTVFHLYELKTL